jgi:hypothetical protein
MSPRPPRNGALRLFLRLFVLLGAITALTLLSGGDGSLLLH